jgi:hypothetical protein
VQRRELSTEEFIPLPPDSDDEDVEMRDASPTSRPRTYMRPGVSRVSRRECRELFGSSSDESPAGDDISVSDVSIGVYDSPPESLSPQYTPVSPIESQIKSPVSAPSFVSSEPQQAPPSPVKMHSHHVEIPRSSPRVTRPGIACESEREKEGSRSASEASCIPPSTTTPSLQAASPPSRIQQLIAKICPELQRITQAQSTEELHQICGFDCNLTEIEEALNALKVDAIDARAKVNRLTDVVSWPAY